MNREESHHENKGFNGFWLGVIVGAAIVFLFATKKGKKILKLLSDEGFENIAKIIDKEKKEIINEEDTVPEEPVIQTTQIKEDLAKPKKRRFFKRAN